MSPPTKGEDTLRPTPYFCQEHLTRLIYFVEEDLYYCPDCDEFMDEIEDAEGNILYPKEAGD